MQLELKIARNAISALLYHRSNTKVKLLTPYQAACVSAYLRKHYKLQANNGNFPYYKLNNGRLIAEVYHSRNGTNYNAICEMFAV